MPHLVHDNPRRVYVCPNCDTARSLYGRTGSRTDGDDIDEIYCGVCDATFDEPVERQSRSPDISTDDLLLAVADLADRPRYRDGLGGGVSPETLADVLHKSASNLRDRLTVLAETGHLVAVQGIAVDGDHPRTSYLPVDHADAPEGGATTEGQR